MKMARKLLFNAPENGRNIEGLISTLRKTSPGGMAELADRGGRIGGVAMADDNHGGRHANDSNIMSQKKI